MTDIELLLKVWRLWKVEGTSSRASAVRQVAQEYGLEAQSVGGRASRARRSLEGGRELKQFLAANAPKQTPARVKIASLVALDKSVWLDHFDSWQEPYSVVFLSDTHFPQQNDAALHLAYEVIASLDNVKVISALNDGLDFAKLSRWVDSRSATSAAIDDDVSTALEIHALHQELLKSVAPDALFPALIGNHDLRIYNHHKGGGMADTAQLSLVEALRSQGVRFPATPERENVLVVGGRMLWAHGWNARADGRSSLRASLLQAQKETPQRDFDLTVGHTHRSYETEFYGRKLFNSGCLCGLQPHYMRRATGWDLSFVISHIDKSSNDNYTQIVKMEERNGRLEARYNGKVWGVKL